MRRRLLEGLADKGFGKDLLQEMQKIIDAENSDLFDVLAHIAYALPPLTRQERAVHAKGEIGSHFNAKQQASLEFVLAQYVDQGVEELDQDKMVPLLILKCKALPDAMAQLGTTEQIRNSFAGFQRYLYAQ